MNFIAWFGIPILVLLFSMLIRVSNPPKEPSYKEREQTSLVENDDDE